MKKVILILMFCIAMTGTVNAQVSCWGTPVTGKDGHPYCISTQRMSWYASLAWCDAQGRHLASVNEACDYPGEIYGTHTQNCININDYLLQTSDLVWFATPCVNGGLLALSYNGGGRRVWCPNYESRFGLRYAVCY